MGDGLPAVEQQTRSMFTPVNKEPVADKGGRAQPSSLIDDWSHSNPRRPRGGGVTGEGRRPWGRERGHWGEREAMERKGADGVMGAPCLYKNNFFFGQNI